MNYSKFKYTAALILLVLFLFLFKINALANAAEEGTLKWTFQGDGAGFGSPTIGLDGTIYVCSDNFNLYAINPEGTLKWTFQGDGAGFGSPTIGLDGTIYVVSDNLYAINPDGTLNWDYQARSTIFSSPAIALDGTIYVNGLHFVHAINPGGTIKWIKEKGPVNSSPAIGKDQGPPPTPASPAIGTDGTIYVAAVFGFSAINPDGTLKWVYQHVYEPSSSPAIALDGTIYVGGLYALHAINPDGTEKWSFISDCFFKPVILGAGGIIYSAWMCEGDSRFSVYDPDGNSIGIAPIGTGQPTIGKDNTIYMGYGQGLYAFNPDGTHKWLFPMNGASSPAIKADGTIYVGSGDGNLYAINSSSKGLADSGWPMSQHDVRRTGNIGTLRCELDSKFEETTITSGIPYYTDRSYTLTNVPDYYNNLPMIKTPNNDRSNNDPNGYMKFRLADDASVYVGFDQRATSLPDWMNDFVPTGESLGTSLLTQRNLELFTKFYLHGECVDLGGNYGPGSSGEYRSNYIVLYEPFGTCALDPKFETATLTSGERYYTDRTYTLTGVPGHFEGMTLIRTPNDEKSNTDPSGYLTFEVTEDADVYVAFDRRCVDLPDWMNGVFADTGYDLQTSLSTQGHLDVFMNAYSAGDCVNFGGNYGPGTSGEYRSNYVVFYAPSTPCLLDPKFGTGTVNVGASYYTDRSYTITGGVPSWMVGRTLIKTPNDERTNSAASGYVRFTNPVSWWVYVLFDSRSSSIPNWLNGWELRSQYQIQTSLGTQPYLKVYRKWFNANQCVDLGGNYGPGSSGEYRSNYAVVYGR